MLVMLARLFSCLNFAASESFRRGLAASESFRFRFVALVRRTRLYHCFESFVIFSNSKSLSLLPADQTKVLHYRLRCLGGGFAAL
jgi:hypothetical protein